MGTLLSLLIVGTLLDLRAQDAKGGQDSGKSQGAFTTTIEAQVTSFCQDPG